MRCILANWWTLPKDLNLYGKMNMVWSLAFILLLPNSMIDSSEYCESNVQGSTCTETGEGESKYANGRQIITKLNSNVEQVNLTQRKAKEVRQFLI